MEDKKIEEMSEEMKEETSKKTYTRRGPDPEYDENGEREWHDAERFIIESMLSESVILLPLNYQYDKYGNNKYSLHVHASYTAGRYGRALGGDELVGRGIYIGVALAEPIFQEVGEAFLKKVLPNYNRTEYAVTLFKGILRCVKTPRKAKMEQGIRDILDGRENQSPEVQGARLQRMVTDYMAPLWPSNRDEANGINSSFRTFIQFELQTEKTMEEIFEAAASTRKRKVEKAIEEGLLEFVQPKEQDMGNLEYLEYAYEYYLNHYEEIPTVGFTELLPGLSREEMAAYYVASRMEPEIIRLVKRVRDGIVEPK